MKILLLFASLLFALTSESQFKQADSLDLMIGQMIMIGIGDFSSADSSQPIFQEIKDGKVGGVVLYEKNIEKENAKYALTQLVFKLQKHATIPIFISIDEEGGRVTRLKEKYGFPKNVSAQYLGELDNLDSTQFYSSNRASLLNNFGINMNYAPVIDVNVNPENPVIGSLERSFSNDYSIVIKHALATIKMHNQNNVVSVLKHFPGHGSSRNDTHLGLADVTSTWQFEELFPYRALIDSGMVDAIMTAHIVNRALDSSKVPATLSNSVVNGMLREFLGYDGVIISDDMQMGAIKNEYGLEEAISLSIEAGVDVIMFANNVQDYDMVTASSVHLIIKNLVLEGVISQDRIFQSYKRVSNLKGKYGLLEEGFYKSLKNKLKANY